MSTLVQPEIIGSEFGLDTICVCVRVCVHVYSASLCVTVCVLDKQIKKLLSHI